MPDSPPSESSFLIGTPVPNVTSSSLNDRGTRRASTGKFKGPVLILITAAVSAAIVGCWWLAGSPKICSSDTNPRLTTFEPRTRAKPKTFYSEQHKTEFPEYLREWVDFANERNCLVTTGYTNLMADLKVLADTLGPITLDFLSEMIKPILLNGVERKQTVNYCKSRSGVITCSIPRYPFCMDKIDDLYAPFAAQLPDMDWLCEVSDRTVKPRYEPDHYLKTPFKQMDPTFSNPMIQKKCREVKMPVKVPATAIFSKSKVLGCGQEVLIPCLIEAPDHGRQKAIDKAIPDEVPWSEKVHKVSWAGATTGAELMVGDSYLNCMRFRLVEGFAKEGSFGPEISSSIAFTKVSKCKIDGVIASKEACHEKICSQYKCGDFVAPVEKWKSKYIIDIDGNGWSARFASDLISGSVVLKITRWTAWWQERARPWVHYVPVETHLGALEKTVQWLYKRDELAKSIGDAGRQVVLTQMRTEDMQCYIYRALLEYYQLLDPDSIFV